MTARREQILAAVALTLGALPGFTFRRNPRTELVAADVPALILWDGPHEQRDIFTGAAFYEMAFDVAIAVKGAEATIGAALNAAYALVVNALLADFAPTFGGNTGLVSDFRELSMADPEFLRVEGREMMMGATVTFLATFHTGELNVEL